MPRLQHLSRLLATLALLGCWSAASAQSTIPFDFAVEQEGSFSPVSSSSILTLQANATGQIVKVRLRIRNIRTNAATLSSIGVIGSRFALETPPLPSVLNPGESLSVTIQYTAVSATRVPGEILIAYVDTPGGFQQTLSFAVAGVAPEFRYSYTVGVDGNATAISNGGSAAFPDAAVNSTVAATFAVQNLGSGPGTITEATVLGAAFRAQGLPVFPVALAANTELRFVVRFTPTAPGPASGGRLVLRSSTGDLNISLEGAGVSSAFQYEIQLPDGIQTARPGELITLPVTPVGASANYFVRVVNSGTSAGTISTISVLGAAFALAEVPTLPAVVPPQGALQFILRVTPESAGTATARLRIGNDGLDLSVFGVGSRLGYSYILSGVTIPILPLGRITFPSTTVGEHSQVRFVVRNSGNAPALIPSLSITSSTGAFSSGGQLQFPIELQPDQSLELDVLFMPTMVTPDTATLTVGSETFTLSGAGRPPPQLPVYTVTGLSATVQQLEQPSVGLSLATPYPVALRGQLRLLFEPSNFSDDTSIQFSTGGRSVDFTIPSGQTNAVFSNGSDRVRFQTGTVTGNLVLAPSFSVGSIPLAGDTVFRAALLPAPPRLLTLQVTALTSNSVSFLITGSTPTRFLEAIEFSFTPAPDSPATLAGTTMSVNVRSLSDNFFRSPISAGSGGLFQATVPFTLTIGSGTLPNLSQVVSSVTVTVSNAEGRSNSLSAPLL